MKYSVENNGTYATIVCCYEFRNPTVLLVQVELEEKWVREKCVVGTATQWYDKVEQVEIYFYDESADLEATRFIMTPENDQERDLLDKRIYFSYSRYRVDLVILNTEEIQHEKMVEFDTVPKREE